MHGLIAMGGAAASKRAASSPLNIITSVPVRLWLRADLGVTIATGVSSWVSQEGNAYDFPQATPGAQPSRSLTDATLNNQATITCDGTDDRLYNATIPIAASYWRSAVIKILASGVGKRVLDSAGRLMYELTGTGNGDMDLNELGTRTGINTGFGGHGNWKRVTDQQSNATTDRIKIGSQAQTGSALVRTSGTSGMSIGADSGATAAANAAFAEIIITDGIPTPTEQTNIDTYLTTRYLASLIT